MALQLKEDRKYYTYYIWIFLYYVYFLYILYSIKLSFFNYNNLVIMHALYIL